MGSWGMLVAYWRESTFQILAISMLGAVLFVGVIEGTIAIAGDRPEVAHVLGLFDPFRALLRILDPLGDITQPAIGHVSALHSVLAMLGLAVVLNAVAIARVRVWNPSRSVYTATMKALAQEGETRKAKSRDIWSNPVIWREICTRAYGKRIFVIKLAYVAIAIAAAYSLWVRTGTQQLIMGMVGPAGFMFVGLCLISLILINAQAVTALTSERDGKTLELFLMTDVTAKEFIFGKLGGILYNTKEVDSDSAGAIGDVRVPAKRLGRRPDVCGISDFLLLVAFAAMLGLHAGLSFENSRSAIANSLGTMFFLFVGHLHLYVFAGRGAVVVLSAVSEFHCCSSASAALGCMHRWRYRNPSTALRISAGVLPFLTFYAITQYLLGGNAERMPGDLRGVRIHDAGHARPGHQRIRRRPGPHHARQRLSPPADFGELASTELAEVSRVVPGGIFFMRPFSHRALCDSFPRFTWCSSGSTVGSRLSQPRCQMKPNNAIANVAISPSANG